MSLLQLPPIFSTLQLPLLYANTILAHAIGPNHRALQVGITFPVLVVLVAQSLYRTLDAAYGMRYSVEMMVTARCLEYADQVVLGSAWRERWRKVRYVKINDGQDGEVKEVLEDMPRTFWSRAYWGLRIAMGNRYVGWSQQVKNVPPRVSATYSRWRFLALRTLRLIFMHLLNDLIVCYTVTTPHGSFPSIVHLKPITGYSDAPLLRKLWFSWVHIGITYTGLESMYSAICVLSVALGLASPRDCPRMFGELRGLWSVRNAWSFVWHQGCRRICSAPGTWLVRDVLNLRKGSFGSKYLQLYVAFTISAMAHGLAAVLMDGGKWVNDGSWTFFLGQATVIMFEDHVIDFGKRMGFKDSMFLRVVGFVWTVCVLGFGLIGYSSRAVENGMWVHQASPDWFGITPKFAV